MTLKVCTVFFDTVFVAVLVLRNGENNLPVRISLLLLALVRRIAPIRPPAAKACHFIRCAVRRTGLQNYDMYH